MRLGCAFRAKGSCEVAFTAIVESKGRPAWEEWLNDLDGRRILQELLDAVPSTHLAAETVAPIDERVRAHTTTSEECVWGDDVADREGWSSEREWWYWVAPRRGFRTNADVLREDGIELASACPADIIVPPRDAR